MSGESQHSSLTDIHMDLTIVMYALVSVAAVSLISLIGLSAFYFKEAALKRLLPYALSVAAGAMLGNAFLHLVPESINQAPEIMEQMFPDEHAGHNHAAHDDHHDHAGHAHNGPALLVMVVTLSGFFMFFGFDLWLHRLGHCSAHQVTKPIAWLALLSDTLENLSDGIVIGAAYLISVPLGLATTAAVLIHEIPVELGDFAVFTHAGFSRKKALLLNMLSALSAFIGCAGALIAGSFMGPLVPMVAPLIAGGMLYMAGSTLLPAIKQHAEHANACHHFLCVIAGTGVMAALLLLH